MAKFNFSKCLTFIFEVNRQAVNFLRIMALFQIRAITLFRNKILMQDEIVLQIFLFHFKQLVNVDNGLGHKLLRYIYTELLKRKENYLGFLIPKNMWKIQ